MAHVNSDLATDLVRFLTSGDTDYATDSQRKGFLCPDKTGALKLTTKGSQFLSKWAPTFKQGK